MFLHPLFVETERNWNAVFLRKRGLAKEQVLGYYSLRSTLLFFTATIRDITRPLHTPTLA